jgi:oxygen-independent coproporphyrinogen-3 oxidase
LSQQNAYTDALIREIRSKLNGGEIESIYFGGGTPSRTSIENLRRIADELRRGGRPRPPSAAPAALQRGCEFSIEANPEDITPESLAAWRDLGVNRVSIGVQSFDDRELAAIGRIHNAQQARDAVAMTLATGVRTSLDLILGLPHQSKKSFERTLDEAIALDVGHLSLYMLDLEEGTPLQVQVERGRVRVADDELVALLYARAVDKLRDAGLVQYEVSNFAKAGEECIHNLRYWHRGEYFGFGMAAHSFINEQRFANTRNIRDYIADPEHARDFSESIGADERKRELLFLGLRQARGMYYEELVRLCGQEASEWIERGLRDGWLRQSGERVAFTSSGFLLSNEYISQLF